MVCSIEVLIEDCKEFSTFLNTKIKQFNNEHSVHHKNVRKKESVLPINIILTDEQNKWIGGISAEVYWNWLEINDFWINEKYRGNGLGSSLLKKAEDVAVERGAKRAMLTTFEFQARSFYELYGYKVVGEIEDYPPGSSYYTMVKSFHPQMEKCTAIRK